jgi:hypothetical protein
VNGSCYGLQFVHKLGGSSESSNIQISGEEILSVIYVHDRFLILLSQECIHLDGWQPATERFGALFFDWAM